MLMELKKQSLEPILILHSGLDSYANKVPMNLRLEAKERQPIIF